MKIYNTKAMISTAEIFGEYEIMVMFEDGTELERSKSCSKFFLLRKQ